MKYLSHTAGEARIKLYYHSNPNGNGRCNIHNERIFYPWEKKLLWDFCFIWLLSALSLSLSLSLSLTLISARACTHTHTHTQIHRVTDTHRETETQETETRRERQRHTQRQRQKTSLPNPPAATATHLSALFLVVRHIDHACFMGLLISQLARENLIFPFPKKRESI